MKIEFQSASPFEVPQLFAGDYAEHPVFGELLLPEGEGAHPAIVAIHGSLNWSDHHHEHIAGWVEAGFAVFRLHCFDSRRIDDVVADQMRVTHTMMLCDAFAALDLLAEHPRVDASRIGIAGWSLGGMVALYSAWEPFIEKLSPNRKFAAHVAFYPAAHLRPDDSRWSDAPIRIYHGSADDYTPIMHVENLIGLLEPKGVDIRLRTYEDVHHSFDSDKPLTYDPTAIRLDHRTVTIRTNGDLWAEKEPGDWIRLNTPEERFAAFQYAQNIGCHVKGDAEAKQTCMAEALTDLKEMLDGGPAQIRTEV